jgi:uncharacterized repeat protein (TIGR03837 family)
MPARRVPSRDNPEAFSALAMPEPSTFRWDIFCKVVDNYGDAGVCWRLARQLAAEHGLDVTLWQDDLAALARIAPAIDPARDVQKAMGVTVRRWAVPLSDSAPADVVVEAFGCGLPALYVDAMARAATAPAWFILEYLSAETWVENRHGLPSPHPRLPLPRRFWFPGFTAKTGGLLRERGLLAARDAFRRDEIAQRALWSALRVPPPAPDEIRISLFCYPNPSLPALLDAWSDGDDPIVCVVPDGVATGALDLWTAGNVPHPGHPFHRGRLTLHAIPFVPQDDYDRLLWCSSVNFVRGEDSFVRAQWAARACVWHIYPQAEAAHQVKLEAFIALYSSGLDPDPASALARFWRAWNGVPDAPPIDAAWRQFAAARRAIGRHADRWETELAALPDLAFGLVKAARSRV